MTAPTVPPMVELRLRSRIPDDELAAKQGRIVTDGDYNVLLTGPTKLLRANGSLLAIYWPNALADALTDEVHDLLSSVRMISDNRGAASGSARNKRGDQVRGRWRIVSSGILGATEAVGKAPSMIKNQNPDTALPVLCRLTAWTGRHAEEWAQLQPLFEQIDACYREAVPDKWLTQWHRAEATHPDWRIGDTVFTTVTINNTYSTGVHQDSGDLPEGFSTLAVARRGDYQGGHLVLPRWRVAVQMGHADLLLFDAHEWHGNTALTCPHTDGPLAKRCPEGCERVSLVSYYRTMVERCPSEQECFTQRQLYAADRSGI